MGRFFVESYTRNRKCSRNCNALIRADEPRLEPCHGPLKSDRDVTDKIGMLGMLQAKLIPEIIPSSQCHIGMLQPNRIA